MTLKGTPIITCKYCGSPNIIKRGFDRLVSGKKQRYQCKECNRIFRVDGE